MDRNPRIMVRNGERMPSGMSGIVRAGESTAGKGTGPPPLNENPTGRGRPSVLKDETHPLNWEVEPAVVLDPPPEYWVCPIKEDMLGIQGPPEYRNSR
jgi:hypothetical protein